MRLLKRWWDIWCVKQNIKQIQKWGPRCKDCDHGKDVGCNLWIDEPLFKQRQHLESLLKTTI